MEITDEMIAQNKVERFVSRFEPSYYLLACHAALPLVLTPELVNYLRIEFLKSEKVPWIAEADLLLSNLCRPVGYELYVMDEAVRAYLLQELAQNQKFGEKRIKEIANFLLHYVKHLEKTNPFMNRKELQRQRWGAMLYVNTEETVREIALAISKCVDQAELARLLKITDDFKQQIASSGQFQDFLDYAQLCSELLREPEKVKLEQIADSYQVAGLELTVPGLATFEFDAEVVTIVFEGEKKKLNTILLVEDQPEVIEEISELLSSHYGITVRGTEDVNEVIDQAQSGDIDLILINYDLPNSYYQGKIFNGIEIVDLLRPNLNISPYLPIIGFSVEEYRSHEFLQYADGFYDKKKVLNEGAEQDFINYLRKIFNRVKLLELIPYESAEDLDSVLEFISKRNLESGDTSEEDVSSLWNKPKGDDGTFYLLENLCLLDVLVMTAPGKGAGTVRYDLSLSYRNQNSPRPYSPPDGDKFDERLQQLPPGQINLLKSIRQANERKQDTSLADAAPLFYTHPEGGDIATYRRLENLRLLGFLSIADLGTSRETISYNLSLKYQKYLSLEKVIDLQAFEFKTPTVNRRGKTIKTTTHTASYFIETLSDSVNLEMVAIPGGTFTMGSPKSEKDSRNSERPQHNVTVPSFFMGKYPITQGQWRAIASRTDMKVNLDLNPDSSYFKKAHQGMDRWQRPVERVNWYEAVEFCERLSKLTERNYRLPSEAEWEYACRAGTTTPFHFGETIIGELANYHASDTYADEAKGEYRRQTTPVGQFPPNAFGLYDMHGNVWEWCADDWHSNYQNAPTNGSAWLDSNERENMNNRPLQESKSKNFSTRITGALSNMFNQNESDHSSNDEKKLYTVLRGGCWGFNPYYCRSAYRNFNDRRDFHHHIIGFRIVCDGGSE